MQCAKVLSEASTRKLALGNLFGSRGLTRVVSAMLQPVSTAESQALAKARDATPPWLFQTSSKTRTRLKRMAAEVEGKLCNPCKGHLRG